jgi:hypothetical protein
MQASLTNQPVKSEADSGGEREIYVGVDVAEELWRTAKATAIMNRKQVKHFVAEALRDCIAKYKNADTKEAE